MLRKAVTKSIKDVDKSREKLLNLKNKVRKLDPNQESVNNLKVKISTSQLHLLGPLGQVYGVGRHLLALGVVLPHEDVVLRLQPPQLPHDLLPVGRQALQVLPRGLVHRRVAHSQLLQETLGLHDLLVQRICLGLVPLSPLVPLFLDVVPIQGGPKGF